jgi:hypothetical protein
VPGRATLPDPAATIQRRSPAPRVVVPYARGPHSEGLHPEVVAALEADGYAPETVDVSGSETAYHDLLARLWREGRTLVVVEHDIVVYPGAIGAMLDCPEPWCVTVYRVNAEYEGYLGCVRFSGRLLAEVATGAGSTTVSRRYLTATATTSTATGRP